MPGRNRLRLGVLCLFVVLLSACRVDSKIDIVVDQHGSGTITVTTTADAEVVADAPSLTSDLRFDDAKAAGWSVTGPTALDKGGLVVILTHTFASLDEANALLDQLSGPNGPLHFINGAFVAKQAYGRTTINFNGTILLVGSTAAFGDAALTNSLGAPPYRPALDAHGLTIGKAFGLTVNLTLPGTKTPATWSADFDGAGGVSPGVAMAAKTVYGKDTRNAELLHTGLPWIAAAWAVLFLLVVVPFTLLMRRRKRIDAELEL